MPANLRQAERAASIYLHKKLPETYADPFYDESLVVEREDCLFNNDLNHRVVIADLICEIAKNPSVNCLNGSPEPSPKKAV